MQNVVCCEHTRVRRVSITWAHGTRVAAVRAPEDSFRRSGCNRRLCVCSVRAMVQEARSASACVCEEKDCHRPGNGPLELSLAGNLVINPSRGRVELERGSRQQKSKCGSRRP